MPTAECPHCAARLVVDDGWVGREVECGSCGRRIVAVADGADRPPDPPRPADRRRDDPPDLDWAAARVRGPATQLQVVGWIGVAFGALQIGLSAFFPLVLAVNAGPGGPQAGDVADVLSLAFGGLTSAGMGAVILVGAYKMKRLQSHGFATAAAVVAMVPCFSPCCILGLPFGVLALQALNDPDVRRAFDYNSEAE